MSAFSGRHLRAVRSVQALWPDAQLVVVGGLAVAHHTKMPWRTTQDIDFAIGIDVGEFPGALDAAAEWAPDPDGRESCRLFDTSLSAAYLIGTDVARS